MRRPLVPGSSVVPLVLLSAALHGAPPGAQPETRVLVEKKTRFQTLLVVEEPARRMRHLCGPGCGYVHGSIRLDQPDLLVPESLRTALVGLAFLAAPPRRVLVLGMGAGLVPRLLAARYPSLRVDVVEIDPEVPPLARRWFGFEDGPRTKVHVADAADFVHEARATWDLVFLDALFGPEVAPRLSGEPFLGDLRRCVSPGGVLVVNLSPPELAAGTPALLRRLMATGLSVRVFPTRGGANWITVASDGPVEVDALLARAKAVEERLGAGYGLGEVLSRATSPPPPEVPGAATPAPPR